MDNLEPLTLSLSVSLDRAQMHKYDAVKEQLESEGWTYHITHTHSDNGNILLKKLIFTKDI